MRAPLRPHHDYCHSADLPPLLNTLFNQFVGICSECHIQRDHVAGLPMCSAPDCADTAPATAALAALKAQPSDCSPFAVLQAYHDGCEGIERSSPAVSEGFHGYQVACGATAGCNSVAAGAADATVCADPNVCHGCEVDASAAGSAVAAEGAAHGCTGAVFTTLLVLSLLFLVLQLGLRTRGRQLVCPLAAWPPVQLQSLGGAAAPKRAEWSGPATGLSAAAGFVPPVPTPIAAAPAAPAAIERRGDVV